MKKRMLALGLALVMAASLTACGGSSAGDKSGDAAKEDSSKELTVWVEKVFSDDANAAMQERLDAFSEETGIKVNSEFIAATDFMTKLNAAIEAGSNIPDITTSAVTKVVNYYPNIPYKDVSDLVAEINKERPYFESIYEGTKIDGKHYFVPMTSSSTMMFVRKDKLEEKGITKMPETWDEVFETAEKITDPDNGFYGLGIGCGPTDEDGENMCRMINWDQGGYIFDKDGNITLDNEVTKEFLTKYKEMYDGGVIPQAASTWDPGGNNTSYLMGESGIVFNAPTLYNALKTDEANKELFENTEVLNLPAGRDNNNTMGFATGFAIMESCKDVDSATALIKYMYDKDWYNQYVEITAPVFAPLFQDIEGQGIWADGVNAQVVDYAKNAKGYYGYPVESIQGRAVAAKSYFTFPMAELMNKVVTNTLDVDEAVDNAIKKLEEVKSTVK
ncbi:MAG: ABC transporter substrate-binding protein [Blautia sp.]|jgi:multiple sugar transport system substrate-binding protein